MYGFIIILRIDAGPFSNNREVVYSFYAYVRQIYRQLVFFITLVGRT